MTHYNMSASVFADKIGVQRSSISHILSGRNKPSLEFIMKILSHCHDVDLYWLLNGKGTFPTLANTETPKAHDDSNTLFSLKNNTSNVTDDAIDRIIIFYKDGTFKNFKN